MLKNKVYRIGARRSPLALKQVEEVIQTLKKTYPDVQFEVVGIETDGDLDKTTPLSLVEGSDFFTRQIDEALLAGEIDFAVHSAKDLPDRLRDGLSIVAVTVSLDPYDCLVSKRGLNLSSLTPGASIGASSRRRKEGLKKYRPDFQLKDIRGNIEERLEKLEQVEFDAIVIAACGLMRLGLENRITERIPFEILPPHPLQGCLAVVTRDKKWLKSFVVRAISSRT
ncbi:MAG: hydroxymethylbilane synthase [Candidatus Omnitrophota bacterium]|nr:hydroxymethylbilane synthase [Candidatus Omnitrophota bacterium]